MRGREEYPARSPTESRGKVEARRRTAGEHGPGACGGKHVQLPPGGADIRRNEGALFFLKIRSFPQTPFRESCKGMLLKTAV